jgi:hypothetical protein
LFDRIFTSDGGMFGLGPKPHVNGFLARTIGLALLAILIASPNVLRPSAGAIDEQLSMVTTALASPEVRSESHHVNHPASGCDDASSEVAGQDCHGGGASALLAPEAQYSNVLP